MTTVSMTADKTKAAICAVSRQTRDSVI